MRKILFLLFAICFILAACKKDNGVNTPVIPGRYSLTAYSITDSLHILVNSYDSKDVPCMENNKLTFHEDGSITAEYTGQDVCYFYYKDAMNNFSIGLDTIPQISKWKKIGNDVIYTIIYTNSDPNKEHNSTYKVAVVNGRVQLSSTDVYSGKGFKGKLSSTYTKERY